MPTHRDRFRFQYPDLRAYLEATGDTQANIAARVHVSQAQISRIVAGDVVPRAALAQRLVRYAHVPLDSFARVFLIKHGNNGRRRRKAS